MYRNVSRELALAKLKSDFVSNVSHELRTPLALIRLYAETLELGRISNPGKQQEYYEIIRKESERLTSLINNILDFSRIEAGKKEYNFRETDVADLVRSTLESYRFEIEQNGFQFEQKIDDNLPPLRVDREAIARSLLNLVNNAVKYSANGQVSGGASLPSQWQVSTLKWSITGSVFRAKEQPKIFEKFYRVGDPLVHNTKGSGLGLSLVRHIVQAHGGEVRVESIPGHGSKFVITLPVLASEVQQAEAYRHETGRANEDRRGRARAKILVVEDEPNMVAGLRDNFEFEGYEVITARDGVEGLQRRSTSHRTWWCWMS